MRYIERVLQPGERVLYEGRLHWVIYLAPVLGVIVLLVPGLVLLTRSEPTLNTAGMFLCLLGLLGGVRGRC